MFSSPSGCVLPLAASQISALQRPASGLNIVGGRGTVCGQPCLVKFVKAEAALAQLAADALKPLFGQRAIGCRMGRLVEAYRLGSAERPVGAHVLLLRWIDGIETAKEATRRMRGPRGSAVDLRADDGAIFARWLAAPAGAGMGAR